MPPRAAPTVKGVALSTGVVLSLRTHEAMPPTHKPTVVLVHGLSSNARLWDDVAQELARAGHTTHAVDLRGHGESDDPGTGYDTDTCADDVADLIETLNLDRPVVAGQSWGGNVVLSLAARHPTSLRAAACVDGGWIALSRRFDSFEDAWAALAPPRFDDWRWDDLESRIRQQHRAWPDGAAEATLANLKRLPGGGVRARLSRDHHQHILKSMFDQDPAQWYANVKVPVMLVPAAGPDDVAPAVHEAAASIPEASVRYYPGAHHDLHAQHPKRLARDLIALISATS